MLHTKPVLTVSLLSVCFCAQAAIVQGDFTNSLDLPATRPAGPKVWQTLAQPVGSGVELNATASTLIANPSSWRGGEVDVDLDPATQILTLTAKDALDFETANFTISQIQFDATDEITGITLLNNGLTDPSVVPTLSHTANSVSIVFDTNPYAFDFIPGATAQFQLTTKVIAPPLALTTPTLPTGTQGQAYSAPLAATGGSMPYSWAASGLPAGLVVDPATGAITGTPTASGTFAVVVTVTDGAGQTQTANLSVLVNAPVVAPSVQPVPSLGGVGLGVLAALAAATGLRRRKRS